MIKQNSFLKEKIFIEELQNGLKCYIIPKKHYEEKQAYLAINYGSSDMNFKLNGKAIRTPAGTAHYLEHKMFEEQWGNIFDKFSELGALANAFTNFDMTAYYFRTSENFEQSLKELINFVQRPYITTESVDKERQIIEQEILMYNDNPSFVSFFSMLEAMYGQSNIRHNICGSCESIADITAEILLDCHKAFYRPENMSFICSGDVDCTAVLNILKSEMKQYDSINVEREIVEEQKEIVKPSVTASMNISQPLFNIGFKDCSYGNKMLKKVLIDMVFGESSEFYDKLFSKGVLNENFGYEYVCGSNYGFFALSGECNNVSIVIDAVFDEIKKIKSNGLDKASFERIKNKHIGRFVRGFNSIEAICMGQIEQYGKNDILDAFDELRNISYKDFNTFLFDESNMVTSTILPNHTS